MFYYRQLYFTMYIVLHVCVRVWLLIFYFQVLSRLMSEALGVATTPYPTYSSPSNLSKLSKQQHRRNESQDLTVSYT